MGAFGECLVSSGISPTGFRGPPEGHVLAPYIKLIIEASGVEITVSNRSSPSRDDHAIIKSFEMGYGDRPNVKVTIVDEEGGSWVTFVEGLLKDFNSAVPDSAVFANLEFGWVKTGCGDNVVEPEKSPVYYVMIRDLDCHFDNGKYTYDVHLVDIMDTHAEGRNAKTYGDDANPMFFEDAVVQLLQDNECPPTVSEVKFLKRNNDGSVSDLNYSLKDRAFNPSGTRGFDVSKGPASKWSGNNLDKLNTLINWCSWVSSADGKGLIVSYEAVDGGRVIVWEDPKPRWDENCSDKGAIAKYIVNGSKQSPVLSFNPRLKFVFTQLMSTGGTMSTKSVAGNKSPGVGPPTLNRDRIKCGGAESTHTAHPIAVERDSGSKAEDSTAKDAASHLRAYADIVNTQPIEADLVLVGDPSIQPFDADGKQGWLAARVAIVMVNPYFLDKPKNSGSADCPDWTVRPICNPVLTNRNWLVRSINHQISDGKFTTTLNVFLEAPGVTLDVNQPFGGCEGGWTPPNNLR